MIRRILLPLERTDDRTSAVDYVRALARRRSVEVLLLRVEEWPFFGPFAIGWDPAWRSSDLEGVQAGLEQGEGVRTKVLTRNALPSAAVLEQVRLRAATLILVAYRNESGWMRMMYGNGAERILRESPIPVLAIPSGAPPRLPSRILYVFDGSDAAVPGIRHVIELAQLTNATVVLRRPRIAALPPPGVSSVEERLLEILRRREVPAEVCIGTASAVHDVLASIQEQGTDLVALTRTPRTDKACAGLAREVLQAAAVPLLMTREGSYPESTLGLGTPLRVGV